MYRGVNQLKVDGKGRIALPTRYRDELMERCDGAMVVTVNDTRDHCLWMYPLDEWEPVEKRIIELPSRAKQHIRLKRFFLGYATDVSMDKTGRILLPPSLREFARIGKGAYLNGQGNKFEIWSAKDWNVVNGDWLAASDDEENLTPEMEALQL